MRQSENLTQKNYVIPVFEKLGYKQGNASHVDKDTLIHVPSLLTFLKEGTDSNKNNFQKALAKNKGDENALLSKIKAAVESKKASSRNVLTLLKESIIIDGFTFVLFNQAPAVGGGLISDQQARFNKNIFTIVEELTILVEYPLIKEKYKRRPDISIFVNGILVSIMELKTMTTGQSAAVDGRDKLAQNLTEILKLSCEEFIAEKSDISWTEVETYAEYRNQIQMRSQCFTKLAHAVTVDESSLYIMQHMSEFTRDIYHAVKAGSGTSTSTYHLTIDIPRKIKISTKRLSDSSVSSVSSLIEMLYSPSAIAFELRAYSKNKEKASNGLQVMQRPREPQRVLISKIISKLGDYDISSNNLKLELEKIETDLRSRGFSDKVIDSAKKERLKQQNGVKYDALMVQAAAGLGKTMIMNALAEELINRPLYIEDSIGVPVYDIVLVVVDRRELRSNAADGMQNGNAEELENAKDLIKGIKNGNRIFYVTIQGLSRLYSSISASDLELVKSLRIALLIDEAHRSNTGSMHEDSFKLLESVDILTEKTSLEKKPLIICLTATPTDEVLVKFGEYIPPMSAGSSGTWVPFAYYSMKDAIEDGYVLDPTKNVLRISVPLNLFPDFNGNEKAPTKDEIYENSDRIRLTSEKSITIARSVCFDSIKPKFGPLAKKGTGKAMFVEHSVNSAILRKASLEETLINEAIKLEEESKLCTTEKSRARCLEEAAKLRAVSVFIVYSDDQKYPKCSGLNNGMSEEQIIAKFKDSNNAIMVVVNKLTTGFDETTLQTIFICSNITDIQLFQTVCRVNRIAENKEECWVVDLSHDNTVSDDMEAAFTKYGGMTFTDFNPAGVEEKLKKAFKTLFGDNEVISLYTAWKSYVATNGAEGIPTELVDWCRSSVFSEDPDVVTHARVLWKAATAWLHLASTLKSILDFNAKDLKVHKEELRIQFAEHFKKTLYALFKELNAAEDLPSIVFTVDEAEIIYPLTDEASAIPTSTDITGGDIGVATVSAINSLTNLIESEMEKSEIIHDCKVVLKLLFEAMDTSGPNCNKGKFKKNYEKDDFEDSASKIKEFSMLLNAVKARNYVFTSKIAKNSKYSKIFDNILKSSKEILCKDYECWLKGTSSLLRLDVTNK